MATEKHKSCDL